MTIKIYDQDTNNYLDSIHYLNEELVCLCIHLDLELLLE